MSITNLPLVTSSTMPVEYRLRVLPVQGGGTGVDSVTGLMVGDGTNDVTGLTLTDGQLPIGVTGASPVAASIAAGLNTSVTTGSGTITVGDSQAQHITSYTDVTSSPYTAISTDYFLSVNTGSAITVRLPNSPTSGRMFVIKDRTGTASSNSISVTTVGGSVLVDGVTTYTISTDYQSICVFFNGTNYEVF